MHSFPCSFCGFVDRYRLRAGLTLNAGPGCSVQRFAFVNMSSVSWIRTRIRATGSSCLCRWPAKHPRYRQKIRIESWLFSRATNLNSIDTTFVHCEESAVCPYGDRCSSLTARIAEAVPAYLKLKGRSLKALQFVSYCARVPPVRMGTVCENTVSQPLFPF